MPSSSCSNRMRRGARFQRARRLPSTSRPVTGAGISTSLGGVTGMILRQRHILAVVAVIVGLGFGYVRAFDDNYREAQVAGVASVLSFAVAFFTLFGRGVRR